MSAGFTFSACSLFYSILLVIMYFSKSRLKIIENKIYSGLIISNFFGVILGSACYFTILNMETMPVLNMFISKALLIYYLVWITLFTVYVFVVSYNKNNKTDKEIEAYNQKIFNIFGTLFIIIFLIVITLPLYFYRDGNVVYSYGPSANFLYVVVPLYITSFIVYMLRNLRNLKNKKYLPLFSFIVFGTIVMVIQKLNPGLLLMTAMETFVTFLMYFTIENPDMKMVEELIENRKIIERQGEEKSAFLFKMSQGLREPVHHIDRQVDMFKTTKMSKKDVEYAMEVIDKNNQKINYLINDVLGISSFANSNLKKVERTYNIYSLLEDVSRRSKSHLKEGVEYNFSIASNMPKELYGDSIKLKQVLMSVLINALKNSKHGYVNVDVNSFTKYDVCRLVISIETYGHVLDIVTVNDILDQDLEITDNEQIKIDKLDVDLSLAYKMIKMLGGTMHIKSDVNSGTEVIITLDQYIVMDEKNSDVDSYLNTRRGSKRFLIVNDDEQEIKKIRTNLERRGYDVVISMFGQDAIDRIRNKEKYDVILIDDEMPLMNGINVLEELVKLKNKSKKIVLLEKDKLFIAEHYVKDGFDNYIDKTNLKEELDKKIK